CSPSVRGRSPEQTAGEFGRLPRLRTGRPIGQNIICPTSQFEARGFVLGLQPGPEPPCCHADRNVTETRHLACAATQVSVATVPPAVPRPGQTPPATCRGRTHC